MCLRTKNIEFKIADSDIIAYKVAWKIDKVGEEGCLYKSPIEWFRFGLKECYSDEGKFVSTQISNNVGTYHNVYSGVFHLYKNLEDAKAMRLYKGTNKYEVILKAVIPKGSKYLEGTYGWSDIACYGTKDVMYIEEI